MEDLLEQLRALANQAQGTSEAPKEETRSVTPPKDDIAGRLAGQAVGVNPPPRTVAGQAEALVEAGRATVPKMTLIQSGIEQDESDAELGRAVRVLFAALRGA